MNNLKTLPLKDASLLKPQAYIAGKWLNADSKKTVAVKNPATGQMIAEIPYMGQVETVRAIEAAHKAGPEWRSKSGKERSQILRKWYDLIMQNQEDLALIMTAEQGKPLAEAKSEVVYGASFIEWFAEEGKRIYGDVIPHPQPDKRIMVLKQPVGVVAAITPWNFPNAMITRKCGPALAAGCPIVIKPATQTPLSAFALVVLAERAGFPAGVINIITGSAQEIGKELTTNPLVRKVSFTGSTEVGKILMQQCAGTVKKLSLELGGNAPFIVFDDADLEAAVEGAIASKFRNAGQTCVCANRILVQDKIYDSFAKKLTEAVAKLKIGNGVEQAVQQGPLIDMKAIAKIEQHIEDALKKGAKLIAGGKKHSLGHSFFEPTVMTGINDTMLVAHEETFGPLAPLFRFKTEKEAIQLANATEYGLAGYFYSRDLARVWRVAEALECGIVGINTGIISTEVAPFGGIKESGMGREGSKYGIEDYMEIKYLCVGGIQPV